MNPREYREPSLEGYPWALVVDSANRFAAPSASSPLLKTNQVQHEDLDEITSWRSTYVALKEQFNLGGIEKHVLESLRKAYGGDQAANIGLPSETMVYLINVDKVQIGWVICRDASTS